MKKIKAFICISSLLLIVTFSSAQLPDSELSKKLSITALKEDLQVLKQNLETAHTGLYSYTTKEKMDEAFENMEASISEPMTSIEFYRKLSSLQELVANGHTNMNPPDKYVEATKKSFLQFPFDVYWHKETLYVLRNGSNNDNVKTGQIIRSINGELTKDIFNYLMNYQLRDGYNLTLPARRTMNGFSMFYTYFKGSTPSFQVEFIDDSGLTKELKIEGLSTTEVKANKRKRYGQTSLNWRQKKGPALLLNIENQVAIMSVKTFTHSLIKNHGQKYKKFFNDSFKEINSKGVNHLILDLRGNDGGNAEIAIELFSHLYEKPVSFYKEVVAITQKNPNNELYDDDVFLNNFKKQGDVFRYRDERLDKTKPAKHIFKGDLYVLTDAYSFSATGFLAGMIKNYDRAIFIGEEPGGNACQNTSGPKPRLTLPNSKVTITLPFIFFKINVGFENTGHGVLPDHAVRPSVHDIIRGKDAVMIYTKKLIEKKNIIE